METNSELRSIFSSCNENKMCADCKGPLPFWISINNGIFICEKCAQIHHQMGVHISFLRHINDKWDEYLTMFVKRGGNKRFNNIIASFNIIEDAEITYKYRTKGAEYYRSLLKSELLAEEPPERINDSEGCELVEGLLFNNYPEFEEYTFLKETNENENVSLINENENGIKHLLINVGSNIGNFAKEVGNKISQIEFSEKIKSSGSKAFIVMKNTGGYFIHKTTPYFENLKILTKDGAVSIAKQTYELYKSMSNKYYGNEIIYENIEVDKNKINKEENKEDLIFSDGNCYLSEDQLVKETIEPEEM